MLQWCSQDSLWHIGWWKAWAWEAQDDMEAAADREGLQRVETLGYWPHMIDIPGDQVCAQPWVQQASYLEGGPLLWMLPLYLHVNKKFDDDDECLSWEYSRMSIWLKLWKRQNFRIYNSGIGLKFMAVKISFIAQVNIFLFSPWKHMLWVLIRSDSERCF